MKARIKALFLVVLAFLMAFSSASSAPVWADDEKKGSKPVITDDLVDRYDSYQVYFYNAQQCDPGTTIPGDPGGPIPDGEEWDGSCTPVTATRAAWIKKFLKVIQSVATKNGLPWELIVGQAFQESGGGLHEACDNNPLGLKANGEYIRSGKYCTVHLGARIAKFAKFDSYDEAFNYYANTAAMNKVKNKYPNNPYAAIAYVQSGNPPYFAVCDSESYPQCVGHMGEPTPGYVNAVSSLICGVQKWAKENGIAISPVTWENYKSGEDSGGNNGGVGGGSGSGAVYCGESGIVEPDPDDPDPGSNDLVDLIKKWVWPKYQKDKKEQMPAYAEYMETASYKGACNGNDCGAFVSNIIKASGWDPRYPTTNTSGQKSWLDTHWQRVNPGSLKLGDVGIVLGGGQHHVVLYIGNIPGFQYKFASASQCDHAPMTTNNTASKYTWYRKK